MRHMRISRRFLLLALAAAAACTKPVPGVCCVGEADCARLGVDEPRPCAVGQACRDFACVAAECATAADCTSPDAPACVDHLCVTRCGIDDDCAGAADGPRCAEDGACVGCLADADCPASAPLCDAEDRRCRGCELDAECASGVCLEMDARCASEDEVVFVSTTGQDGESCTRNVPCRSLAYALTQAIAPARLVIHLAGGNFTVSDTTLDLPVYIDGTMTRIEGDGSGPYFQVISSAGVTLANLMINPSSGPAVTAAANATLRIYNSAMNRSAETTSGTIIAARSRLTGSPAVRCASGVLALDGSQLADEIYSMNCQLAVSSSVFEVDGVPAVEASGGQMALENNLFIQSSETADTVILLNTAPGSGARFNTFVNTSAIASDGVALYCDAAVEVSSNIFAYGSRHPHGVSTCTAMYSLYDTIALADQIDGIGNRAADAATFFVNKTNLDFHLAPASPARDAAEPGTGVTRDLEGRPRSSPIGSTPDMGALEAP